MFPKGRIWIKPLSAALQAFVLLSMLLIPGIAPADAQRVDSESRPAQPSGGGKPAPAATLAHMYQYAFLMQDGLEKLAADREQVGGTGTVFRYFLQDRLKLTGSDFERFRASSQRFAFKEREMRLRLHALRAQDRSMHRGTPALSLSLRPVAHRYFAAIDESAQNESNALQRGLGAEGGQNLDTSIRRLYSGVDGIHGTVDSTVAPRYLPPPVESSVEPPLAAAPDEVPPQCNPCDLPNTDVSGMYFTADGTQVIATLGASISEDQYNAGCFPNVVLTLTQDSNPVGSNVADSSALSVVVTNTASVNVGSLYSYSGSLIQSCNYIQGCTTELIAGSPYRTGVPTITGVSPSGDTVGASGTFTLSGTNLGGPPGNTPTLTSNTANFNVSANQPADYSGSNSDLSVSSQSVDYSSSASTAPGAANFTVSTVWGSGSGSFTLSCGTPTIAGVNPGSFSAGHSASITINGSGFCYPGTTLSAVVGSGSVTLSNAQGTPTQIFARIYPDPSDPAEPATLTVSNPNGQSATYPIQITNDAAAGDLFMVDPGSFSSSGTVDTFGLVNSLPTNSSYAVGLVADGVSTFVATYMTSASAPVTFTASGGISLLSYDPNFPSNPQGQSVPTGSGSVTVQPGDPNAWVFSNGNTYALALVRAPLATSAAAFQAASSLTVAQGTYQTASLVAVYPKPVLFVHGLWGNQGSLGSLANYVQANGTSYLPGEIVPICYSQYLGFDQTVDNNPPSACELTSRDSVTAAITNVGNTLTSEHVVHGLVDFVGHSMGGLVARNYSVQPEYYAAQNLNQGAFSTVVSIDTPEAGSALADWLVNNASDTLQAPYNSLPGLLWVSQCGLNPFVTLQTCFAGTNKPFTSPGAPLAGGAVDSLRPSGSSILNAPPAAIPNANWKAISAVYSESSLPASLLRGVLNTFVDAVLYYNNPPTLTDILGGGDNDVIVTTSSQNAGKANPGIAFPNLEHTDVGGSNYPTVLGFAGLSDTSVLQSPDVAQSVSCLLSSSGTQPCSGSTGGVPAVIHTEQQTQAVTDPEEHAAELQSKAEQAPARPHFDENAIRLVPPSRPIVLGQPSELDLQLSSLGITKVHVSQLRYLGGRVDAPAKIFGSAKELTILSRADGTNYIVIEPLHLGQTGLSVSGESSDGSIFLHTFMINVVLPRRNVQQLIIGTGALPGENIGTVHLSLDQAGMRSFLVPQATFPGLSQKVELEASQVKFSVVSLDPHAAVSLDPSTAILHPVHPGHALVRTEFGHAVNLTCVVVTPTARTVDRSSCEELLAPGETLSRSAGSPERMKIKP